MDIVAIWHILFRLIFGNRQKRNYQNIKTIFFGWVNAKSHHYHEVFDATYTWRWMHATEEFYHGRMNLQALLTVLYKSVTEFPVRCVSELILPATMMKIAGMELSLKSMEMQRKLMAVFSLYMEWNSNDLQRTGNAQ